MKFLFRILPVLFLFGCTTAQMGNTAPLINSLINTAVATYGAQYGVPPVLTTAIADKLEASAWGMAHVTYTGAPATGADPALATVAVAIQAKLSASNLPSGAQAVVLEDMATKLAAMPTP